MTARRTIGWFVLFVLLGALLVGGYTYVVWSRRDEILQRTLSGRLKELLPHGTVQIGRARFDWYGRIRIYNFSFTPGPRDSADETASQTESPASDLKPIVSVPEIILTVDRKRLNEQQQVDVQKIRLLNPKLNMMRDRAGDWNWESVFPLRWSERSCPEWVIEQGRVRIDLETPDGLSSAGLALQQADVQLIPSGKREFLIQGQTELARRGQLSVEGRWNLDAQTWQLSGQISGVPVSQELFELAANASPELRAHLVKLGTGLNRYSPRPLDRGRTGARSVPNFGLTGTLDVTYHMARPQADAEPDFTMLLALKHGQITHPALPFPLHDLKGQISWDNHRVRLHKCIAKNGITRLEVAGQIERRGESTPLRLDLDVDNLLLDERLQSRLPRDWLKVYNTVRPSGRADVAGTLTYDGEGTWTPHDFVLAANRCTISHVKFPYPVHELTGTIRQQGETGDELRIEMDGLMGRRPVQVDGWVRHPGPEAEARFDAHVQRLPLDDIFRSACPPAVQKTLASLKLEGLADIRYRAYRPPGRDRKYRWQTTAQVNDGALQCEAFPYPLSRFSGTANYDSTNEVWTFEDLQAVHGSAKLSGQGRFVNKGDPQARRTSKENTAGPSPSPPAQNGEGLLDLTVTAEDVELDKQLELALPRSLQLVWEMLSPSGRLNVVGKLAWTPGRPPKISFPEAELVDAELRIEPFPYPLDDVDAKFSYKPERVTVSSFSCRHEETSVSGHGFVEWPRQGDWRVRFDKLVVEDLIPDRLFRRALPDGLRRLVEGIDPKGPLSLSGTLEFRGATGVDSRFGGGALFHPPAAGPPLNGQFRPTPVTADWNLKTVFAGGAITAGVALENIHGTVTARGGWNGQQLDMTGQLDLESLWAWGHQFTQVRGPYRLTEDRIVVGSEKALTADIGSNQLRTVPLQNRVTARAIEGLLTLDAEADFQTDPISYHARMTMNQGQLEQYARRYLAGINNVRGDMTGWIDVEGRGSSSQQVTGRGQLRIHPAALYELPIVVQIFKVLRFVPPDRTAFNYAFLDFALKNQQFEFSRIDLDGDAIRLRGRGTARFDGTLTLEFYSMLPRNRLRIPFVDLLVGEVTEGWVGVEVRGNVSAPQARVIPAPNLEEAVMPFLRSLERRPPDFLPRLIVPPPRPPSPPGRRNGPRGR